MPLRLHASASDLSSSSILVPASHYHLRTPAVAQSLPQQHQRLLVQKQQQEEEEQPEEPPTHCSCGGRFIAVEKKELMAAAVGVPADAGHGELND